MAHLEVHTPQGPQRVELGDEQVTLGRGTQTAVPLDDSQASRSHCLIGRTRRGYALKDLGSRNGTTIGGERIDQVLLKSGTEFLVGQTRVVFVDPSAAPATATANSAVARQAVPAANGAAVAEPARPPARATAGGDGGLDDLFTVEDDDTATLKSGNFGVTSLESLAHVGDDVPFGLEDVALVNARSQTVHAAGSKPEAQQALDVLRLVLFGCIRSGASDIHLEPKRDHGVIRLRIDGTMVEVSRIETDATKRMVNLIKVLCDIDFTKKAAVQEGHFAAKVPGRHIDYRVSFTPAMFGQKLVIRVLDPTNAPQRLRDLQLPDWMYVSIRNMSRQNTGMLVTCGPTGSGKTTTLYAVLREIDAAMRNVITIEDPVEYEIEGVTQMPVDSDSGHTFANLLRSVLRQDPDVVVLGEIRDAETATAAMQAATTGHLVLSTIHAKDTVGTIFRLLDLGVEPYLVASTLNHVLAQRLVRKLCPHCKTARQPTPPQVMRLGKQVEGVREIHVPAGCPHCFGTGFSGRQGLFELLTTTDELRDVILHKPDLAQIKRAMEMTMFTSLRDAGMEMVLRGETSLDEIDRVVGRE